MFATVALLTEETNVTPVWAPLPGSFHLNDVWRKLPFPFVWCSALSSLCESHFWDLTFTKKKSKLIRWKVVWGTASINIICAEIKAEFYDESACLDVCLIWPVSASAPVVRIVLMWQIWMWWRKYGEETLLKGWKGFYLKVKWWKHCVTHWILLIVFYGVGGGCYSSGFYKKVNKESKGLFALNNLLLYLTLHEFIHIYPLCHHDSRKVTAVTGASRLLLGYICLVVSSHLWGRASHHFAWWL